MKLRQLLNGPKWYRTMVALLTGIAAIAFIVGAWAFFLIGWEAVWFVAGFATAAFLYTLFTLAFFSGTYFGKSDSDPTSVAQIVSRMADRAPIGQPSQMFRPSLLPEGDYEEEHYS
ncbi:MAG: hypothetical protein OEX12_01240 [Gammaproteobacteria bacterium]|nr:hypothetical protein [Gammaproteobacteria bacterium]